MKKILYISASSKPEEISTSKTISNELLKRLKIKEDYELTMLDLYSSYIPLANHKYYSSRASLVSGDDYEELTENEKNDVNQMNFLSNQFLEHDIYIISTPMWSISFPSILKQYLDNIILNDKLISIDDKKVAGLLNDKERKMVYIQSSGGDYPLLLSRITNHGLTYIKDIFNFLGIKTFIPLLIEGTEQNGIGKDQAMKKAIGQIESVVNKLIK